MVSLFSRRGRGVQLHEKLENKAPQTATQIKSTSISADPIYSHGHHSLRQVDAHLSLMKHTLINAKQCNFDMFQT
jgi:hypothetical protein